MTCLLQGAHKYAQAYLDDILIFSKTFSDHIRHIRDVFERIRQHKFKLNLSKCFFVQPEIIYLGFKLTASGILPDNSKITTMENYPVPKNLKELRTFIGAMSYLRKFIPNFLRQDSSPYKIGTQRG